MRYLKTNTATTITVGPFLDKTDGITPEVSITVTGIHITFMVDNAGTPTLAVDADATASGGNNDMVHITNDDAGYYSLELAAANVNYLGGALLSLNIVGTACPVFHEFMILPANAYDAMVSGTGVGVRADTQGWLGTAPATPTVNGVPEVDVTHYAGSTTDVSTVPASVAAILVDTGTTLDGRLPAALTANGNMKSSMVEILTTALTETAGLLAGGFKKFFNIATPASTMDVIARVTLADTVTAYTGNTPQTGDTYALANGANGFVATKADTAAIKAKTDNLPVDPADASDVAAAIAALTDITAAEVKAEVVAALNTDTYPESTGVPAATATLAAKINRIHTVMRNAITVTASKKTFFDDAGVAMWEKDVSDDDITYTESEGNAI